MFAIFARSFLSNQNDRDFGNDFDKYLKVPLIKYKCTVRDVFCFKWYIYSSEFGKKMSRNFWQYNKLPIKINLFTSRHGGGVYYGLHKKISWKLQILFCNPTLDEVAISLHTKSLWSTVKVLIKKFENKNFASGEDFP